MAAEDAVVNRLHDGYDIEVEQLLSQGLGVDFGDVRGLGGKDSGGGRSGGKQRRDGWDDKKKKKKKNYGGFDAGVGNHQWDGDDVYRYDD